MVLAKRMPDVQGSADPLLQDCVLVPADRPHRSFPKVNTDMVPPGTFYRYSTKRRKALCLVSMAPQGFYIAWEMCGECFSYFTRCACRRGVASPGSVNHITGWAPAPRQSRFDAPAASTGLPTVASTRPATPLRKNIRPPEPTPAKPLLKKRTTTPDIAELNQAAPATADRLSTLLKNKLAKKGMNK